MSSPEQNYFLWYAMRYPVCARLRGLVFCMSVQYSMFDGKNKYICDTFCSIDIYCDVLIKLMSNKMEPHLI